ncbi:MAG: aminoacyl-histidine dipeptidase [Lachnospiraceae bacterium]|nr:aminoacyl-histidine dipeptidase [Lachnospiraceae bacterium]
MSVLTGLQPANVFRFFEEICGIPHGSGNVDRISDYLAAFAKDRRLFYIQDEAKNVIIIKAATPGYEEEPALIIQGHMDMVAVKKPDCDINLETDGLRVAINGDKIYAEGTSLGGDDGIAVAYALAILDSNELKHPRIEVVITVDEETGLDGAKAIDLSVLKGSRLLNLDSEEEGVFLTSCAGGARVACNLPVNKSDVEGVAVEIVVNGLQGGHSGAEIHKERGNSNCLMARLLQEMTGQMPVALLDLKGGLADNAIPRETVATVVVAEEEKDFFLAMAETVAREWQAELASKDPGVKVGLREIGSGVYSCVTTEDTRKAMAYLYACPNGVQAMSADMPGMVETSLNMGILELKECVERSKKDDHSHGAGGESGVAENGTGEKNGPAIGARFNVRSSVESAKEALIAKLAVITELAGADMEISGEYPGWQYRVESPLREKMMQVYREMYGTEPKVEAIHAGLECGILGSKIKDPDCVSMGPDMRDIHTTEETLSISSVARVWDYLVKLLETKD